MTTLRATLEPYVERGAVPGALALAGRGERLEVETVGFADLERTRPLERDALFRVASLTKPITAAAVCVLLDEGRLSLDAPIAEWLPELAAPRVVRTPAAPPDDVVPAARPITVRDVLTSRAGWGFPSDFSLPAVAPLLAQVQQQLDDPHSVPPPEEWLAWLAELPLLHQPGDAWLYNTCSDIQGVLVARASGRPFPEFLRERLFAPLRMVDTGFEVPPAKQSRLLPAYRPGEDGVLAVVATPPGPWTHVPAFPSGAGGLVSTLDDWLAFARMLLAQGGPVLSRESVRLLTTNHLTDTQRGAVTLFLEGQGWGFGGSVDVEARDPWNVPGRYGWIGGSGTAAHVTPATGDVVLLLTQAGMTGPTPTPLMRDVWRHAAAQA